MKLIKLGFLANTCYGPMTLSPTRAITHGIHDKLLLFMSTKPLHLNLSQILPINLVHITVLVWCSRPI